MRKVKWILLIFKFLLLVLLVVFLTVCDNGIEFYSSSVYYFIQNFRSLVFDFIPFSVGDLGYLFWGIFILVGLIIATVPILKIRLLGLDSFKGLLFFLFYLISGSITLYICFIVGWGINYYKEPIRVHWNLKKCNDTLNLYCFDSFLIQNLNALQSDYQVYPIDSINKIATTNFERYTNSKVHFRGNPIKYSLYSYFLDRMAIEGYFNPFTGEGQISRNLPQFLLPFVITHEMTHKAGIAREGDANLLAYAISTTSENKTFKYSAYFNIFLYVDKRLKRRDAVSHNRLFNTLNSFTKNQLDTLDKFNQLFDNSFSDAGEQIYDNYLKMQQQNEGIKSYGNVVLDAWRTEHLRSDFIYQKFLVQ